LTRFISGEWDWSDLDQVELFAGLREPSARERPDRTALWQAIGETARPRDAIAFLVALLGSRLERESVAAAAALWRPTLTLEPWGGSYELAPVLFPDTRWWGGEALPGFGLLDAPDEFDELSAIPWVAELWGAAFQGLLEQRQINDVLAVGLLSRWRLALALRSPDPITRSLGIAALLSPDRRDDVASSPARRSAERRAGETSMMIHGTRGWKGDWWRPRGEFHEFILRHHRPNLYSRATRFSWSGAYRADHRAQAAMDFCEWTEEVAPAGLQTVFAHSYGGEVAARAAVAGASISELVQLSVPATRHVDAGTGSIRRVVDVRLRFDPVLALAATRQRMAPRANTNVSEVLLGRWRLDHRATHHELVWRDEDVARRAGLVAC
jgi:hypothetical protein